MSQSVAIFLAAMAGIAAPALALAQTPGGSGSGSSLPMLRPPFEWTASAPVLDPKPAGGEEWHSVKDPSVVRDEDRWHLFCTVRGVKRSHAIVYLSFKEWAEANQATRYVLPCHTGYFCAPQVFHFSPQRKWYLICQASDKAWTPNYQPAFSTTTEIGSPASWTTLKPMWPDPGTAPKAWLDFWVICDSTRAHLFFTSLDGKMWRAETPLNRFPEGWSKPVVALEDDIFEASHTYRLRGTDQFLTLVEAQNGHGWRYYKAYVADRLDGKWEPLAATKNAAFASMRNVGQPPGRWTDAVSHGELLRADSSERLEVAPLDLRFLIQGVLDRDRAGLGYGLIPWRLGLLELRQR